MHIAQTNRLAFKPHRLRNHRLIHDRHGVGHGEHGGKTTLGGSGRTRGNGFRVLPAGFPQVNVQVHQTRQQDRAFRINHSVSIGIICGIHVGDQTIFDQDVHGFAFAIRADVADQHTATLYGAEVTGCRIVILRHHIPLLLSVIGSNKQREQHRHAHVHTITYLLQHGGLRGVRNLIVNFHAAQHRPWVHHYRVFGDAR